MKYWQKKALENFKKWINETPREELIKKLDKHKTSGGVTIGKILKYDR